VLGTPTGSAAIEAFLADARGTLEAWALDHEIETDPIASFEDAVRSQFGALSSVRVATGGRHGRRVLAREGEGLLRRRRHPELFGRVSSDFRTQPRWVPRGATQRAQDARST
jgi:hypothetical protein